MSKLGDITGIAHRGKLLELGRIVEDVLEAQDGAVLLTDWTGDHHAIAVIEGQVFRASAGRACDAGVVFISDPFETIRSHGAVAFIAQPHDASRLAALLVDRRRPDVDRARAQRRATRVLLDRVRQPAGRPGHREDDLPRARNHAAYLP